MNVQLLYLPLCQTLWSTVECWEELHRLGRKTRFLAEQLSMRNKRRCGKFAKSACCHTCLNVSVFDRGKPGEAEGRVLADYDNGDFEAQQLCVQTIKLSELLRNLSWNNLMCLVGAHWL